MKDKRKILKATRGKKKRKQQEGGVGETTYKGIPLRLTADLSSAKTQAKRQWDDTAKVLKEKTANQESRN